MNTLVDMISGMEVKEDDEDFMNAVDYMFAFVLSRYEDTYEWILAVQEEFGIFFLRSEEHTSELQSRE